MAATVKKDIEKLKQDSEQATNNQVNDIFDAISKLGANDSEKVESEPVREESFEEEEPIIRRTVRPAAKPIATKKVKGDDKRGFISLVVSPSLKTKWKTYSTNHGMSLTDCIKLGMKLLEEMEQQGMLQIEDGVVTMSN